ncbi:MAG: transglutaminase family protein [Gaiellaceae bacterium]
MLIGVEHRTSFVYAARISEAYTELRVRPLSGGGQHCTSFRLVTDPPGVRVRSYRDRLGNDVQHLEVLEDHDRISITAVSEVSTPAAFADSTGPPSPLQLYDYLAPTEYAPFSDALRELSAAVEGEGTEAERAAEVMRAVRGLLVYEPGATDVMTRADAALALGRGVCQDFAHVMLAACRRAGIPSRYVSGYLYDPLGQGEVASHAWVDVLDAERGWVSFDPTHDREQTEAYVRVAVGRDYADVPPTRGVFRGTAEESLEVAVRIAVL